MGLDKNAPIGYMKRTREYYLGLGYDNPYQWANFTEVPFVQPVKALAKMRIAIVTTAAPYQPDKAIRGRGQPIMHRLNSFQSINYQLTLHRTCASRILR